MKRPRFTVRRMMVAVAVASAVVWAVVMVRRRAEFLRRAERCGAEATVFEYQSHLGRRYEPAEDSTGFVLGSDRYGGAAALAEHYSRLQAKYNRAARRPWLPVDPDPPEPE